MFCSQTYAITEVCGDDKLVDTHNKHVAIDQESFPSDFFGVLFGVGAPDEAATSSPSFSEGTTEKSVSKTSSKEMEIKGPASIYHKGPLPLSLQRQLLAYTPSATHQH